MSQIYDVIVVGCGAAGIAAIRRLHDAGLSVLGLEGADQIGGRINTVQFADNVVDLGAQWCHGEDANIVFELANEYGLLGKPESEKRIFLKSNGNQMSPELGERYVDYFENLLETSDKSLKQTMHGYLQSKFNGNTITEDREWALPILNWYKKFIRCKKSAEPNKSKSLAQMAESWPCSGEQMLNWKDKGFKTILDILLKVYPNPEEKINANILLGKEVINVMWKSDLGFDSQNTFVQVKCKDGSLYASKHVIITISLNVLKERHINLFNPPLPDYKVNAINNLDMVILDKIYIQFTKPWWPASPAYIGILWQAEDVAKISPDNRWISEIYGLSTVEYQPNLLCAWILDEGAKTMESLSIDRIQKGIEELLKYAFYKEFNPTEISQILRTQWSSNPLIRGTYSHRSLNTELHGGSSKELSEPLCSIDGKPIICFAGEATSHCYFGAVHGAIESGFREADRLIELKKKN